MAASAVEASNVLAETYDPQACGSIIDKAVFADMSHTARQSRNDYLRRLVECKADSVNITSAVRCIRLGVGFSAFAKMIVPGGKLDVEFFEKCYGSSPEALMSALEFTDYAGASSSLEVERRLANMYYETACEAEKIPFGAELLVCCIVKKEYEIRNFRVILAGKACGLDAAKIKERLVIAK